MRNSAACIVTSLEAYGQPIPLSSSTIKAVGDELTAATRSPFDRHECQGYVHKPARTSTHSYRRETLNLHLNN
jgi:hypothetical protein